MKNKLAKLLIENQREVAGLMCKFSPFMIVSSAITATIATVSEAALEYSPETIIKYTEFIEVIKNYLS